jgi:hypothetical protein
MGLAGARLVLRSQCRVTFPLLFPSKENSHAVLSGSYNRRTPNCFVVFLVDNLTVANAPAGTEPQKIVNWDVATKKLHSSIATVQEGVREVRKDVHEATR